MATEKTPLTLEIAQRHTEKVRAAYLDFHNVIDEAFDAGLSIEMDCVTVKRHGRNKPHFEVRAYIDPTDLVEA